MRTQSRILAAVLLAATTVAVAGCSGAGTAPSSSPSPSPVLTSSTLAPVPSIPPPTGSVGGIDVTIAAQNGAQLRPGGEPMNFTVTLTNTTPADIPDVTMVVSFGHCACGHPGASIMPQGTMRMLDPTTNAWVDVDYVAEGTGMDYLNAPLVPPFVLKQGQTDTYTLQAQLNADPTVTAGTSLLNVTLTTPSAQGQAASLQVTVVP